MLRAFIYERSVRPSVRFLTFHFVTASLYTNRNNMSPPFKARLEIGYTYLRLEPIFVAVSSAATCQPSPSSFLLVLVDVVVVYIYYLLFSPLAASTPRLFSSNEINQVGGPIWQVHDRITILSY